MCDRTERAVGSDEPVSNNQTEMKIRAVRRRMECERQTATCITETFGTVERLVREVKSDEPLTKIDSIGTKEKEAIDEWWNNRFERERKMNDTEYVSVGRGSGIVYDLGDWSDALGMKNQSDN